MVPLQHRVAIGPCHQFRDLVGVTYLRWNGTLPSGTKLNGVTVMTRDAEGRINHIAVNHRPLGILHEFSANIGRVLSATTDIPADNFFSPPETSR